MYSFQIIFAYFFCLAFSGARGREIGKDMCATKFLNALMSEFTGKWTGGKVDPFSMKFNLAYKDKNGAIQTAAVQLTKYCTSRDILCEDDIKEISGEKIEGPLLHCAWKWDEMDKHENYVIVRSIQTISLEGRISKENGEIFPGAGDIEPINFKIMATESSYEESLEEDPKGKRLKREELSFTNKNTVNKTTEGTAMVTFIATTPTTEGATSESKTTEGTTSEAATTAGTTVKTTPGTKKTTIKGSTLIPMPYPLSIASEPSIQLTGKFIFIILTLSACLML